MSQTNGSGKGAKSLLSKPLDWPTVILILFSGGANFFATSQNSTQRQADAYRAFSQIQDLHNNVDEFEKRQKTILENMERSLDNQTQMLKNQKEMLDNLHAQTK